MPRATHPPPHRSLPIDRRPLPRSHPAMVRLAPPPSSHRQSLPLQEESRQAPDLAGNSTVVIGRLSSKGSLRDEHACRDPAPASHGFACLEELGCPVRTLRKKL